MTKSGSKTELGVPTIKPRLERAFGLLEPAREVLRRRGKLEEWGDDTRMLVANYGGFEIQYRTPFQKNHGPPGELMAQAAAAGLRYVHLPYAMHIYSTHHHYPKGFGQVMSLEWKDCDHSRMKVFRSGEWEKRLIELAQSLSHELLPG